MARILVVDDEPASREGLVDLLRLEGHAVESAAEGQGALERLRTGAFDLVLTDLRLPGAGGLEIMAEALARDPLQRVILITGFGTVETAVEAIQRGAYHYLTKPVKPVELKSLVGRALEDRRLREQNEDLHRRLGESQALAGMIGGSRAWTRTVERVRRVAPSDATVLLTGESGTGKELVADAIHQLSRRAKGPLVKLNCAAIPRELVESELFGHVRGAYTGAVKDKKGRFERADGGTLFLDEIGEMSLEAQARLLRVLQGGEVEPVGAEAGFKVDVRVVAATNKNLSAAIAAGAFREDLYYRLEVVRIELPPLRERREDVPLLVAHFLAELARRGGGRTVGVDAEAMEQLAAYAWPGNVRELRNAIEGAMVTCENDRIRPSDLPERIRGGRSSPPDGPSLQLPPDMTMDEIERGAILQALERTGGNRAEASARLGISLRTMQRKLKQYKAEGRAIPGAER